MSSFSKLRSVDVLDISFWILDTFDNRGDTSKTRGIVDLWVVSCGRDGASTIICKEQAEVRPDMQP